MGVTLQTFCGIVKGSNCQVQAIPVDGGWHAICDGALLNAQKGQPRLFKSFDAVVSLMRRAVLPVVGRPVEVVVKVEDCLL